jgi:hypothetical protein
MLAEIAPILCLRNSGQPGANMNSPGANGRNRDVTSGCRKTSLVAICMTNQQFTLEILAYYPLGYPSNAPKLMHH